MEGVQFPCADPSTPFDRDALKVAGRIAFETGLGNYRNPTTEKLEEAVAVAQGLEQPQPASYLRQGLPAVLACARNRKQGRCPNSCEVISSYKQA